MDDNAQSEPQVIDGEVVESTESQTEPNSEVNTLLSLENLIKSSIESMDRMRIDLKKLKELQEDALNNDPTYKEHADKVKEANKIKNATKQQIFKQPSIMNIANKAKNLSSEIKEKQESLSDYLKEYQRMAGVNQIELGNGEVLEIVSTVKVVRKMSSE